MTVQQAIIPAAGFSSRLHPLSLALPKLLLPVYNKKGKMVVLMQQIFEELLEAGIHRVGIIWSGQDRRLFNLVIETIIGDLDDATIGQFEEIKLIKQHERDGLGGAILEAKTWLNQEPFLVVLGDHIFHSSQKKSVIKQLIDKSKSTKKSVLGIYLKSNVPNRCYVGIRHDHQSGHIYEVVQVDTESGPMGNFMQGDHIPLHSPEKWCVLGAYIAQHDTFPKLERLKENSRAGNEIQWSELIRLQVLEGRVGAVNVDGESIELGDPEQLSQYYRNRKLSKII